MKTNILYGLIVSLALVLCGCQKILQQTPKSALSTDNYFTDDASLTAGIVGAYEQLPDIYTNGARYITRVGTDIESSLHGSANATDTYQCTPNDTRLTDFWKYNYVLIQRTNVMINRAPKAPDATKAVIDRVVAEAKFLRALAYFNLVRIFGPVPLVLTETQTFDFGLPRESYENVYNQILSDLNWALTKGGLSQVKNTAYPERVNYWEVMALKGKVLLTMASYKQSDKLKGYEDLSENITDLYSEASECFDSIIGSKVYSLDPIYGDVFSIADKNINSESIWEIQFSSGTDFGSGWSKYYGIAASGKHPKDPYKTNGMVGEMYYKPTVNFYGFYRNGDTRAEWNLPEYTINYTTAVDIPTSKLPFNVSAAEDPDPTKALKAWDGLMGVGKYRWGLWNEVMPYNYSTLPTNIIMTRYAEILLDYAECQLEINGNKANQNAVDAVNQIVQRARGLDSLGNPITAIETPDFPDYTTSTLTFDSLFKERARELCFEGKRWYALARTGQLKLVESRIAPSEECTINEDVDYLYPIPQVEIDRTTNPKGFYQNPGY